MSQQALGRQYHQRKRIAAKESGLPAEQMEVLRRRRAVDDADVDIGRRLQEALGTRTRMLGSLAFVPVREQEHERRLQSPLGAARGHELVDDHLRAVDEVSVL